MKKIDRVLFYGSKKLGLQVLKELHRLSPESLMGIVTFDDSADSRTVFKEFISFSKNKHIPLYIVRNNGHFEQTIEKLKPELCFGVCWYWLIHDHILNLVPYGFIGLHNSLLPKYRGGSPLVWQLINGEKKVGFSLFTLTTEMDAGPIWAQGSVLVQKQDYIVNVLEKLEKKTLQTIKSVYPAILSGKMKPKKQSSTKATYCAQRFPFDGIVDWSKSALYIYNFIRAQSDPYPGAFTYVNNKALKIVKAQVHNVVYYGTPGQIAQITKQEVFVICGDQKVVGLQEIEVDGVKSLANIFIKSIKVRLTNTILHT